MKDLYFTQVAKIFLWYRRKGEVVSETTNIELEVEFPDFRAVWVLHRGLSSDQEQERDA